MSLFKPNIDKLKAKKKVKKLISAGKHPDPVIRKKSLRALGELGDKRAVEPLLRALRDKDCDVVIIAGRALGEIGDERAIEPLMDVLSRSPKPHYEKERASAASALGKFCELGNERTVDFFLRVLSDNAHLDIHETAKKSLERIDDKRVAKLFIQALKDGIPAARKVAVRFLDRIGWDHKDPLDRAYHLLAKKDRSLWKEAGGSTGPEFLRIFLSDRRLDIRVLATQALGVIGDERAVESLIQALKDEEIDIRKTAAWALGEIKDKRAVEPLIRALTDKNFVFRVSAAEALARIGDVRAVEPLIQALKDQKTDIRDTAVRILGELGDQRAVEPLIHVLMDKNFGFRAAAAEALAKIGGVRAADPLIRVLKDEDLCTESAAIALGRIGDRQHAALLIDYLFSHPEGYSPTWEGHFQRRATPYREMFRDYAELLIRITSYETSAYRPGTSPLTWFNNKIEEAPRAVKELCDIDSPISSNILHKIAEMRDIKVLKEQYDNDETYTTSKTYGTLSVEPLRIIAREELGKRGSPPYDPSAYLLDDGWRI
jgi:HEAT repeat protein